MPRSISQSLRNELEATHSGEFMVVFATITHPDIPTPIRIAGDVVDYILDGKRYLGCPFELSILSDGESLPRGRISIANVDQRVGAAIEDMVDSPRIDLQICAQSDFDAIATIDGQRTRAETSTATVEYDAKWLRMTNITVDAISVSADISSFDVGREYWPGVRAIKANCPGLYK